MGTDPHDALARATEDAQRWLDENALVGVCDFCARPTREADGVTFVCDGSFTDGIMVFDGRGFSTSEIVFSPDWFACNACVPAVESGDPEILAEHAFTYRDKVRVGPVTSPDYRKHLARLYRKFFDHNPQRA